MHDVLTPKNLLEIKFTLDIIRSYLTEQRDVTTKEIKKDYYAYIQYNLILVLAYTVIIMILILLDWKFVYRTVRNQLMLCRRILTYFRSSIIYSNAYITTL